MLYLRFKDDHGANWGMKIYPREKIQLGCSRTNVSDENVVLVMKKVRRGLKNDADLHLGCVENECISPSFFIEMLLLLLRYGVRVRARLRFIGSHIMR